MIEYQCRVCSNNKNNGRFIAREMMFGIRDEFEYFECSFCGCVQISQVPNNLSRYYSNQYYSLQPLKRERENLIKALLRRMRSEYCLYERGFFGKLLAKKFGIPDYYEWLKNGKVRCESKILEIGCGSGNLLFVLTNEGFKNILGIDPYIDGDIVHENGTRILKKETAEINEKFDFIMMHHSFEHLPDSNLAMKEIYRLLSNDRFALIRIPLAGSYAWKKYQTNWVQLDPPRHLYLHTLKSIQLVAENVGFKVSKIKFDSSEFQFWGSEQYIQNIPLRDPKSYQVNPNDSTFTPQQIEEFKKKSEELNEKSEGDQACFYLYKR